MPFECIWGKLKRKEQIRYLHWIVSCVGLSVLNCHDKQLNSLNNPIWTNVWLTNNSTSILTTINCLFCRNCKNDVFYPRICKHALYESSEWFCHAPRQPANPCLAVMFQQTIFRTCLWLHLSLFHLSFLLSFNFKLPESTNCEITNIYKYY